MDGTLKQEKMDIVFVGHVDHGNSTVIGRLLADTNSLPKGKLDQVKLNCEQNNEPFEYAYLIDALKDERAQSITIDSARVFFNSKNRHYIIIDAPGHIEFIKNMVTGAARAEAAVLVIDAHEGIQENSRRHGYLLGMLGIKQILVLVNKMDLVDYDQKIYENIQREFTEYLNEINIQPKAFIPVSGKEGINLNHLSDKTHWYQGNTLLEALDDFEKDKPNLEKSFRMPVQDIYKFTSYGDDRRIIAGTVISGKLNVGDEVIFYPSGKRSKVKTFEVFGSESYSQAISNQTVGFTLDEQLYIRRGEVACRVDEPQPYVSKKFRASVFWLGKNPMRLNQSYTLKLGTTRVIANIEEIHRVIDADKLGSSEHQKINKHDVAEVTFELQNPITFELSESHSDISRFVILDDSQIWGGGIILESVQDEDESMREEIFTRNSRWIRSHVSYNDRAERNNQHSSLIIITGKQSSGRKKLASMLETQLFLEGKLVYYLGVGSVLYGLNADLKRDNSNNWNEHIRRISELAYIFMDSGMILVMTAVELTEDDLHVLRTIIGHKKVKVVWVGDDIANDMIIDLQIDDDEVFENSVIKIKQMLKDRGSLFNL